MQIIRKKRNFSLQKEIKKEESAKKNEKEEKRNISITFGRGIMAKIR